MTNIERILTILAGLLALAATGSIPVATAQANRAADEAAIGAVVIRLSDAWRAGDGDAWAREFTDDADFTVWFGMRLKGAEQIAEGHRMIFESFYANTSFDLDIRQLRFLGDDTAVLHLAGAVVEAGAPPASEPDAVPVAVLQRISGDWKIVVFQNTPFAVDEFGDNGNLSRFKRLADAQQNAARPAAPVLLQ